MSTTYSRSVITHILLAAITATAVAVILLVAPRMLSILLLPLVFVLFYRHPEYAMIGVVAVTATFVFLTPLPSFRLGPAELYIPDILLMLLFGFVLMHVLSNGLPAGASSPVSKYLLLLYGAAVMGFVVAIQRTGVPPGDALWDLRMFSYYLLFFPTILLLSDNESIQRLCIGLVVLSLLIVLGMALQSVSSPTNEYISGWIGSHQTYGPIVRVFPPGAFLLLYCFVLVLALGVFGGSARPLLVYSVLLVQLVGILITFSRVLWLLSAMSVLLLLYKANIGQRVRFVLGAAASFVVIAVTLSSVLPVGMLAEAVTRRFSTVVTGEVMASGSARDRGTEFVYAVEAIAERPLIGGGLGFDYRPPFYGVDDRNLDFVHNSFLWFLKDMGFVGLVSLLMLFFAFIVRGFRRWHTIENPYGKSVVLANATTTFAMVLFALQGSPFIGHWNVSVFGLMMGVSEAFILVDENQKASDTVDVPVD